MDRLRSEFNHSDLIYIEGEEFTKEDLNYISFDDFVKSARVIELSALEHYYRNKIKEIHKGI